MLENIYGWVGHRNKLSADSILSLSGRFVQRLCTSAFTETSDSLTILRGADFADKD